MQKICAISGKEFEINEQEIALRKEFGFDDLPTVAPKYRFQKLGAFWQHWNLHKRKCDFSGENIISVFRKDCPYPVWHRDEWIKNADPKGKNFDKNKPVFEQMWEIFQKSPIPHNTSMHNENCEYTDDWWRSKNCYLCHSGYECEDLKYCYRPLGCKDCQFCIFSFYSELCVDLINSYHCFESFYLLNCRNIQNSAFLYDCRNCSDCLFCFNLRNKKYCFGNQQLTKEAFFKKKSEWDFTSQEVYLKAKKSFVDMMKTMAWHRAVQVDKCENASGNYLENCKNAQNCFFIIDIEDSVNCFRGGMKVKNSLEIVSFGDRVENVFSSIGIAIGAYDVKFSFHIYSSNFIEYSAFLQNCEHCFGCCGLFGKKYYIFNKPYSKKDYFKIKDKIISHMKKTQEYGKFFPGYFSPAPYEESISSFYFPLKISEQKKMGFRVLEKDFSEHKKPKNVKNISEIPDNSKNISVDITKQIFWDTKVQKPFQIQKDDVSFCQKLGIPLPHSYYMNRIQENFSWMFFNGELRETKCGKCRKKIKTNWPKEYDGRILCEDEYLEILN